jgi:thioredoxin 2
MSQARLDDRGVVVACPSCGRQNRVAYERLDATTRCADCKTPLTATATPLEVPDSHHFDLLVERAAIPVVVDYWAPWCGPCRMVAPELAKVAGRSQGRFLVAKVNTDVLSDVGERFRIRSIPTMAVFAGGREITRTAGARPAAEIEAFVTQALRAAS